MGNIFSTISNEFLQSPILCSTASFFAFYNLRFLYRKHIQQTYAYYDGETKRKILISREEKRYSFAGGLFTTGWYTLVKMIEQVLTMDSLLLVGLHYLNMDYKKMMFADFALRNSLTAGLIAITKRAKAYAKANQTSLWEQYARFILEDSGYEVMTTRPAYMCGVWGATEVLHALNWKFCPPQFMYLTRGMISEVSTQFLSSNKGGETIAILDE